MKLSASVGLIVSDLLTGFTAAALPTLKAVFRKPSLVLHPKILSHIFMATVWEEFSEPVDEGARPAKIALITPNAKGVVLDIGAGFGHSTSYFDRTAVEAYIALEPNTLMHGAIRARAEKAGFSESDRSLLILGHGVEDSERIRADLDNANLKVDTLLSVMTLCSVPDPQRTVPHLVQKVLVPGGCLLFYEHVLSRRRDVAWWQRFWTPVWRLALGGCCLDRPTHLWIAEMQDQKRGGSMWSQQEVWGNEGEPEEYLFWHRLGKFVKRGVGSGL
ncbi:hypothetical protein B0H13DRAFT_2235032 [Mycena leptocephala]|nr:hypothetical protein B0H13DRAFT_2235032 [Mycena leptocephala]